MASTITRDTWVDDSGTPTAPVGDGTKLQNSVLQNNIYARIDAMFAGAGAYATFTFGGMLAVAGFGTNTFSAGGSGGNILSVRNTTAGTTNYGAVQIGNDGAASAGEIRHTASSFSATGSSPQDALVIRATRVGGLAVAAENASGVIKFFVGGTSEKGRMFASGGFSWGDTTDPGSTNFRTAGTITAVGSLIAPNIYINDTSNASSTSGLTINQGAADNEILSLKSSDVAHGMTTVTETDTFGYITKLSATDGGLLITGLCESTIGSFISGAITTEDTTHASSSVAAVMLHGITKTGTTVTNMNSNANIVAIRNGNTTRYIFDSDGNAYADVQWTTFDVYEDVSLLRSLNVLTQRDAVKDTFGAFLTYNRDDLLSSGIVTEFRLEEGRPHAMVNFSKLAMLHTGAIVQVGGELQAIKARLAALEAA